MALVSLLSPAKLTSGVTWGFGPAFIFPTGTSQANIQYLFGDSWQTGMAPNILIDWKADQENRFTVPVGWAKFTVRPAVPLISTRGGTLH